MAANPEPAEAGLFLSYVLFKPGLGTPELGRLGISDDGAAGSGGGGIIEAADGPLLLLPGGGLDLETLLMRSSNMAISRSGKLPIILYNFCSPAWKK